MVESSRQPLRPVPGTWYWWYRCGTCQAWRAASEDETRGQALPLQVAGTLFIECVCSSPLGISWAKLRSYEADSRGMPSTTIASRRVPIYWGDLITVQFSAGRKGEHEAGVYEFWAAFDKAGRGFVARCKAGLDPGGRFRRME